MVTSQFTLGVFLTTACVLCMHKRHTWVWLAGGRWSVSRCIFNFNHLYKTHLYKRSNPWSQRSFCIKLSNFQTMSCFLSRWCKNWQAYICVQTLIWICLAGIQQLQLILLKVALIVAVEFHINVEFVNLLEPQENEGRFHVQTTDTRWQFVY